ncbi:MAG: DUF192 domain-containing protein [Chloroflexota bacterium]
MADYRRVVHTETGRVLLEQARWCETFGSKLRGFTFRRRLRPGEGLVLVEQTDGRLATAIHMLFVFCDLGVIWVNAAGQVVDTRLARPWRPLYLPHAPARYVIEGQPDLLGKVAVGDHLRFGPG